MSKLIEDYLKDLTPLGITDGAIGNILIKVGVSTGADIDTLSVREKDLCEAYTYLWCSETPTTTGSIEDSDGGWTHKEGSKQVSAYDKMLLRRRGLRILAKYGIKPEKSTIQITPGGIRLFPGRK